MNQKLSLNKVIEKLSVDYDFLSALIHNDFDKAKSLYKLLTMADRANTLNSAMRTAILANNVETMKFITAIEDFNINQVIEHHSQESSLIYSAGYNKDHNVYDYLLTYPNVNLMATNSLGVSFLGKALLLRNYTAYQLICERAPSSIIEDLKQQVLNSSTMNVYGAKNWTDMVSKSFTSNIYNADRLKISREEFDQNEDLRNINVDNPDFFKKAQAIAGLIH